MGADPVVAGVAVSWARPGGNVTGVSLIATELEAKRLDLLRKAVPGIRRVATLSTHREVVERDSAPSLHTALAKPQVDFPPAAESVRRFLHPWHLLPSRRFR